MADPPDHDGGRPMLMVVSLLGTALAVAAMAGSRRRRRRRVALVAREPAAGRDGGASAPRRIALAVATAAASIIGFGPGLGTIVAAVAAGGILITGRSRPPPVADAAQAAIVVDLIAGCLEAGLSMPVALDAAAGAGDPVTRAACAATAASLRAGVPAADAWLAWMADPWLAPAARVASRTTETGAAAADDLARSAARLRARRRALLQRRVQRAGVWVVVPLGLCFLPAFVLAAVVPVVIGLFGSLP
jgi:Flp pilus assembly protein TadB